MITFKLFSRRLLQIAVLLCALGGSAFSAAADDGLTVFAAASLKNALDEVNAAWKSQQNADVIASYAATSALAKQVESGAPADVFISADLDWMKYLADKNLIRKDSQFSLLGNELVLIAPKDSSLQADIKPNFPLATLLGGGRIAVCDLAVPCGRYAAASLQSLGVWQSVEHSAAQTENVRAALKLVATGEAPLGIVYATDARAEPAVKVVGVFPSDSHPPIIYPVAILTSSQNGLAAPYVDFLKSAKAKEIFSANGFTVLPAP